MIYFMQSDNGQIKIGYTDGTPEERLKSLQTGCPFLIRILGTIEGDLGTEKSLHDKFAEDRLAGEWFKPSLKLMRFISDRIPETHPMPEVYRQLTRFEPGLVCLWDRTIAIHQSKDPVYCFVETWYGHEGLKKDVLQFVGWEARAKYLKTRKAYDYVYDLLSDLLPPCRECYCGSGIEPTYTNRQRMIAVAKYQAEQRKKNESDNPFIFEVYTSAELMEKFPPGPHLQREGMFSPTEKVTTCYSCRSKLPKVVCGDVCMSSNGRFWQRHDFVCMHDWLWECPDCIDKVPHLACPKCGEKREYV